MTVKECFDSMGADYEEIIGRLGTEERIQRFLLKFPNDKSFELLCTSIKQKNMSDAFRAAHTLKGVCQNLSLTPLYKSADLLTERLRNNQTYGEDVELMLQTVKDDYAKVIGCIKMLG
jgi:HPt (histidine-containing phosphotransfer) domain-containing protein